MFSNLFGKKEEDNPNQLFKDCAYMTVSAKMHACAELALTDEKVIFIAWFSETYNRFKDYFTEAGISSGRIIEAGKIHAPQLLNNQPVFVEHYPLHSKEITFTENWQLKNIPVYSALDEPLFKHFGSDKVIPMMKMMGMKENEVIEHNMVTKSINKGQQKIEQQVVAEQHAHSQEEWMRLNLP